MATVHPAALAHDVLGNLDPAAPVAFVVHGILGSRRNWGSFVRRLSEAFPQWRVVSLDLRNHGDTDAAEPPHTVRACAADLALLAETVGQPRLLIGHSFGGKVVLTYARDQATPALVDVWALDSTVGVDAVGQGNEVAEVIARAHTLPIPAPSREAVISHFLDAGFSEMLSRWMTTNVRRRVAGVDGLPGGFTWRFDLDAIEAMLNDYLSEDLWPWLAQVPPEMRVHILRAGKSDRWIPPVVARLATLPSHVSAPVLADAGHWVHVDNPDGLFALLAPSFEAALAGPG